MHAILWPRVALDRTVVGFGGLFAKAGIDQALADQIVPAIISEAVPVAGLDACNDQPVSGARHRNIKQPPILVLGIVKHCLAGVRDGFWIIGLLADPHRD